MSAAPSTERGRPGGLPVGTRVQWRGRARFGTVMLHEAEYSRGCFPVRFDDGIWEKCDVSDVIAVADVAPPPDPAIRPAGRRKARRATAPLGVGAR